MVDDKIADDKMADNKMADDKMVDDEKIEPKLKSCWHIGSFIFPNWCFRLL